MSNNSTYISDSQTMLDSLDDHVFKDMKYARIIDLIADKQNIPHETAMDMF